MQSSIIVDRYKKTCMIKYGVENVFQNKEIQNRQKHTCIERYGYEHPSAKYLYDGLSFDSSPELVYFIYLKDNNVNFEYHPDTPIEYFDNNVKHLYYPDFYLIDKNRFVEVKGSHFFYQGPGIMINPYNGRSEQSKYNCMLEHNAEILLDNSDKIKECFKYVKEKYGFNYIKQFKLNRKYSLT